MGGDYVVTAWEICGGSEFEIDTQYIHVIDPKDPVITTPEEGITDKNFSIKVTSIVSNNLKITIKRYGEKVAEKTFNSAEAIWNYIPAQSGVYEITAISDPDTEKERRSFKTVCINDQPELPTPSYNDGQRIVIVVVHKIKVGDDMRQEVEKFSAVAKDQKVYDNYLNVFNYLCGVNGQ